MDRNDMKKTVRICSPVKHTGRSIIKYKEKYEICILELCKDCQKKMKIKNAPSATIEKRSWITKTQDEFQTLLEVAVRCASCSGNVTLR